MKFYFVLKASFKRFVVRLTFSHQRVVQIAVIIICAFVLLYKRPEEEITNVSKQPIKKIVNISEIAAFYSQKEGRQQCL